MLFKILIIFVLLAGHVHCYNKLLDLWYPDNLINNISNRTFALQELITTKSEFMKQYLQNIQNKGSQMHAQVVDYIHNKADAFQKDLRAGTQYITDAVPLETVAESLKNVPYVTSETTALDLNAVRDPDIYLTTPQIIVRHGYSAESHTVKTEDGYLLTLHRIPYGKNTKNQPGKTVLLHHGLLGSSADWILAGPDSSLAYILADDGYDVWMGNARGNTYSRAHVNLTTNDEKFWNFSWHEIGYYDLPAYIDYINQLKGIRKEIIYIGHSMGTTSLFVMLSTRPEYNKKINSGYALAPVAYMSAVRSPVRLLAPIAHNIEIITKMFGANEFLPQNFIMRWLSEYGCEKLKVQQEVCENILFVICGFDKKEFNRTLMPVIFGHVPAGTSTKNLVHYAQEINAEGRFQYFDYGEIINHQLYGTKEPPEYPLDKITLPIALFSAKNDWLAGESDVEKLFNRLKNGIVNQMVPMPAFNHLDFLIGIDAPKLVYEKLISLMNKTKGVRLAFSIISNDFKVIWQ